LYLSEVQVVSCNRSTRFIQSIYSIRLKFIHGIGVGFVNMQHFWLAIMKQLNELKWIVLLVPFLCWLTISLFKQRYWDSQLISIERQRCALNHCWSFIICRSSYWVLNFMWLLIDFLFCWNLWFTVCFCLPIMYCYFALMITYHR